MNLLLRTDFTIFLASLVCVECSPKGGGQIFGIPQLLLSPFEVTVVAAVRNKNLSNFYLFYKMLFGLQI